MEVYSKIGQRLAVTVSMIPLEHLQKGTIEFKQRRFPVLQVQEEVCDYSALQAHRGSCLTRQTISCYFQDC